MTSVESDREVCPKGTSQKEVDHDGAVLTDRHIYGYASTIASTQGSSGADRYFLISYLSLGFSCFTTVSMNLIAPALLCLSGCLNTRASLCTARRRRGWLCFDPKITSSVRQPSLLTCFPRAR